MSWRSGSGCIVSWDYCLCCVATLFLGNVQRAKHIRVHKISRIFAQKSLCHLQIVELLSHCSDFGQDLLFITAMCFLLLYSNLKDRI